MSGIFDNVVFGERLETAGGYNAIYVARNSVTGMDGEELPAEHTYAVEGRCTVHWCDDQGRNTAGIRDFDVVGRLNPPTDRNAVVSGLGDVLKVLRDTADMCRMYPDSRLPMIEDCIRKVTDAVNFMNGDE